MAFITTAELRPSYDVIVVGSGAAGGQSAYTLTMEGARVLLLEAGRAYDPTRETPMFQENFQGPLRAENTPDKPYGFYDATVGGGWNVPGEPYTQAFQDPARQMMWWRSRMLGGRTNHWSRIALRHGPYDFKPRSRDGLGFDWPVDYAEIAPYYDRVEQLIGVYGTNESLENIPTSSPGVLLPPPPMRVNERLVQKHAKALGLPVIAARRAVLSRRLDSASLPAKLHPGNQRAQRILAEAMDGRAACFWATQCERGCSIKANYQSPTVHLPPALATGNLDILTDAMACKVEVNTRGRADAVVFIDKKSGLEHRVPARAVVLAAGAYESVRLLLNSRSSAFPEGIGNDHGLVGRYIMNTVGSRLSGQIPALENIPPHNEDGAGGVHAYVPWWQHGAYQAGKLDFARGYHIEFGGGRGMPSLGTGEGIAQMSAAGYGKKFKADARRYYGSFIGFAGRGEMIPNDDSRCEIDPKIRDRWGIPVLRFRWKWSAHELKQAEHMQQTFADLIEAMGGRVLDRHPLSTEGAIQPGGRVIHEVGGAIMGEEAAKSVLNRWGQVWTTPNVIVADGAAFCSSPDKNPTLTIMALAWRAADHLLAEMQRQSV